MAKTLGNATSHTMRRGHVSGPEFAAKEISNLNMSFLQKNMIFEVLLDVPPLALGRRQCGEF